MILKFEFGKSYGWIFWLFLAVLVPGIVFDESTVARFLSGWALPATMFCVVVSALRSGVTLDSSWTACILRSDSSGLFHFLIVAETLAAMVLTFMLLRN